MAMAALGFLDPLNSLFPPCSLRSVGENQNSYQLSVFPVSETCEQRAPADVLERLSDQFEVCLVGRSQVRREWERREDTDDGPSPL